MILAMLLIIVTGVFLLIKAIKMDASVLIRILLGLCALALLAIGLMFMLIWLLMFVTA